VRDLVAGPNPTRVGTDIRYTLPRAGYVDCSVYDGAGRRVAELVRGRQSAGLQSLHWDASGVQPGVYVVRLGGAVGGSVRVVKAE
jgi:hypothetical protein